MRLLPLYIRHLGLLGLFLMMRWLLSLGVWTVQSETSKLGLLPIAQFNS